MKLVPFVLAAAAFGAGTAAVAAAARPAPRAVAPRSLSVPADCPLQIRFASYGAGIDGAALETVDRMLRRDRAVRGVSRHHWGREGETTLCAEARTRADAARLFRILRARIPARPRGPISLSTRDGLSFETPPAPLAR